MTESLSRYGGSLPGLTVGDKLGITLEFRSPGSLAPITNMVGGGPFRFKTNQWADGMSMALCLATGLVLRHGLNARDQMDRCLRGRDDGFLSLTGECFDIGNAIASAHRRYERTGKPYSGPTGPKTAGRLCSLVRAVLRSERCP